MARAASPVDGWGNDRDACFWKKRVSNTWCSTPNAAAASKPNRPRARLPCHEKRPAPLCKGVARFCGRDSHCGAPGRAYTTMR